MKPRLPKLVVLTSKTILFSLACAVICSAFSAWAQSAPPSRAATVIDSMPQAKRFDQTAISPDGTQVAYILERRTLGDSCELAARPAPSLWKANSSCATSRGRRIPNSSRSSPTWQGCSRRSGLDRGARRQRSRETRGSKRLCRDARFFSRWLQARAPLHRGHPAHRRSTAADDPARGSNRRPIYEQRLTTIDLTTNTLAQVTPAECTSTSTTGRPTARLGSHRGPRLRRRELVGRAALSHQRADRRDARDLRPKWQIADPHVSPDGKNVAFIEGLMSDEGSPAATSTSSPLPAARPEMSLLKSRALRLPSPGRPPTELFSPKTSMEIPASPASAPPAARCRPSGRAKKLWRSRLLWRLPLPRRIGHGGRPPISQHSAGSLGGPDRQVEAAHHA